MQIDSGEQYSCFKQSEFGDRNFLTRTVSGLKAVREALIDESPWLEDDLPVPAAFTERVAAFYGWKVFY